MHEQQPDTNYGDTGAAYEESGDDSDPRRSIDQSEDFPTRYTTAKYRNKLEVAGSAPSPRWLHSSAMAPDQSILFIFGGQSTAGFLNDFYTFDFTQKLWEKLVTQDGPGARMGHSTVLFRNKLYLFGGETSSGIVNDFWQFDFDAMAWSQVRCSGVPSPRAGHVATVSEVSMFIHGGYTADKKCLADLHRFDFETSTWVALGEGGIGSRCYHTGVLYKGSIYYFGGFDAQSGRNDFWKLDVRTNQWEQMEGEGPHNCSGHSSVVTRHLMYVTGPFADIYEFDFDYNKWCKIITSGDQITPRMHHTMVVKGFSIFLFGGGITPETCHNRVDYIAFGKDEYSPDDDKDDELSNQPESEWEAIAMRRHPEILELRERLRPLTGQTSYARMARPARTEVRQVLSNEQVLQLIMEHLELQGHSKTVEAIQKETNLTYIKELPGKTKNVESRMSTLLRFAALRLRNYRSLDIFDHELPKSYDDEFDKEVIVVESLQGRTKGSDVFIWDEPPDSRKNIIKQQTQSNSFLIKAGSLNKLVENLALDPKKPIDLKYIKIFVHTYQSFTTPQIFLKKLVQYYQAPIPKGLDHSEFREKIQTPIAKRICNVLKVWIEKCSGDFNEKLLAQLNSFIDGSLARDGHMDLVKIIRAAVSKSITNKQKSVDSFSESKPEPKVPIKIFSSKLNFSEIDEEEIARQLTLIDFAVYQKIQATELLNKAWLDAAYRSRAPNVVWLCNRYHELALWVATNIVNPQKVRGRVKVIERFIRIAKFLRILNNFHTLFGVLAGLQLSAQYLPQTFLEVSLQSQTIFAELVKLVPPKEGEATSYKEMFHASVDALSLPALPYLDVVLREILGIEENYADMVATLINFEKRVLLFGCIQFVQEYQRRLYNLQSVFQVKKLLKESVKAHLSEKEIENLARQREQAL